MTKRKAVPYSVRQGDVLLVEASYRGGPPTDAQKKKINEKGDAILAQGEITGHAHKIKAEPPVDYFDANAERFLQTASENPLTHEEHGTIPILPRKDGYQQAFQVEDFGEEVRHVTD